MLMVCLVEELESPHNGKDSVALMVFSGTHDTPCISSHLRVLTFAQSRSSRPDRYDTLLQETSPHRR